MHCPGHQRQNSRPSCRLVERVRNVPVENPYGCFLVAFYAFLEAGVRTEHVVLYKNVWLASPDTPLLLRIHSACITSEVFHDGRCDCRWQLHYALRSVAQAGTGMIIYHVSQEGRGAGLANKLRSYSIMTRQMVTSADSFSILGLKVDSRSYEAATLILEDFGIRDVRLMTNNPLKVRALQDHCVRVHEVIPIVMSEHERVPRAFLDALAGETQDLDLAAWRNPNANIR